MPILRSRHQPRRAKLVHNLVEPLEERQMFADGILPFAGPTLNGFAGVPLSGVVVATFSIADSSGSPGSKWDAKVDWGDSSAADIRVPPTAQSSGDFAFLDTHTYSLAGVYSITVMIAVPGSHLPNDNTVTTMADIALAPMPGDTNGDGFVNIDDYLAIDRGFLDHLSGLSNGDFNHDGTINAADYAIIDASYLAQGGSHGASEISLHTTEFGAAYSSAFDALSSQAVPEPASLAVLGLGAMGLLRVRRRKWSSSFSGGEGRHL